MCLGSGFAYQRSLRLAGFWVALGPCSGHGRLAARGNPDPRCPLGDLVDGRQGRLTCGWSFHPCHWRSALRMGRGGPRNRSPTLQALNQGHRSCPQTLGLHHLRGSTMNPTSYGLSALLELTCDVWQADVVELSEERCARTKDGLPRSRSNVARSRVKGLGLPSS